MAVFARVITVNLTPNETQGNEYTPLRSGCSIAVWDFEEFAFSPHACLVFANLIGPVLFNSNFLQVPPRGGHLG